MKLLLLIVTTLACCLLTEASSLNNGDSTKTKKIIPDSVYFNNKSYSEIDTIRHYCYSIPRRYVSCIDINFITYHKGLNLPIPIFDNKENKYVFSGVALIKMPQRNINSIVGVIAGIDSRNGETPNIKGARAEGTAYFIDGVRTYQLEPYYLIK